jgi:hypothetical protein
MLQTGKNSRLTRVDVKVVRKNAKFPNLLKYHDVLGKIDGGRNYGGSLARTGAKSPPDVR